MPLAALPRPHRDDVRIAAAGLLGGLAMWSFGLYTVSGRTPQMPAWVTLVPLSVMAGCELLRRTPPWAIITGVVALTANMILGSLLVTVLMFTDIVYAAVLYGPKRMTRSVPAVSVIVSAAITITLALTQRNAQALSGGLICALISVAPAWSGLIVRQHRDTADAATLRAQQTAVLAESDRRQAVAAERARMARELHDMVANNLSAIAIHSTAALSIDRREGPARDALGVIRENSVQGLAEMRRLIGLLRDTEGDAAPAIAPSLDALDALLEHARAGGADSGQSFVLRDDRPRDAPALPTPVELAAYRIVQESLTNALKHAAPGEVLVALQQDEEALTVTVGSPYGDRDGPRAPGSGSGLIGMRERSELLGGSFEAGVEQPADTDGKLWLVRAVLPMAGKGRIT
ncbi:histidine kinase [Streptomyces sp. H10-C2]|uniref:sensor histidine kinase n=1 Tax=unclassified Streptomyces TaxID=2593676 RepID=UPI0024B8EB3B|nr:MULTISPECIES: histidine kinase [unclassified Streptomyces]MDJ0342583.1 histidine kinase [Streptomyces sp. PH10-H1]MDJ0370520.1 histidine kinase [Streptomyces sp. H10-C2]